MKPRNKESNVRIEEPLIIQGHKLRESGHLSVKSFDSDKNEISRRFGVLVVPLL